MNIKQLAFGLLTIGLISCNSTPNEKNTEETATYSDIKIVGAMKNVMWKGELGSSIDLDTISDKNGLYGLAHKVHFCPKWCQGQCYFLIRLSTLHFSLHRQF